MKAQTSRRVAIGLLIVTILLALSAAIFVFLQHRDGVPARYDHSYGEALFPAIWTLLFSAIGALIISRQPRNRIGWVFFATGLGWALAIPSGEYARYALFAHAAPFGRVASWIDANVFFIPLLLPATFLLMWFPDGELPSGRWRLLPWVTVAGLALGLLSGALLPNQEATDLPVDYPWRATGLLAVVANIMGAIAIVAVMGAIVASVAALIVRYRRTRGEERQRVRIFAWAAAIGGSCILLSFPAWSVSVALGIGLTVVAVMLVPIAAAVAILRYRLYDLDLVFNKAVVFGALAAFITAVYIAIVVGIGAAIGRQHSPVLSLIAIALVAVAFQPVRERVQRFANRLVYGKRATPYEVMSGFSRRVAETLSIEQVLPEMAEAAAQGVGAARSYVRVFLADGGDRLVSWPEADGELLPDRTIDVRYQGAPIGELAITKPPGERLSPSEEKLLKDLASQAGLAFHNVRLTEELAAKLDELSEQSAALQVSRQRLVTARDAQRRGLERDIREGPQRQLTQIAQRLEAASTVVGAAPEEAETILDRLGEQTATTLEGLRDLARGVFPPLLAEKGVVAALEAHIRKVGANATIDASAAFAGRRYDADTEACVYFCCLQAIQNVARHAEGAACTVRLDASDEHIEFDVADDGPGFDVAGTPRGMGLSIMQDRVDALDGELRIESRPEIGTAVSGKLPIRGEGVG